MKFILDSSSKQGVLHVIPTEGLGNSSFVVTVGGIAVALDVPRDFERVETFLRGTELQYVVETHIHNDYATGGHLLATKHGAQYILPRDTGATVPHLDVTGGDRIQLPAGWMLEAVHTPGHTEHHMAYKLIGPQGPIVVFTGGSMLAGAVGRTDLVSSDRSESLSRSQFRSVRSLASSLPPSAIVAPTHGGGSFCTASSATGTTSTIEVQMGENPALTASSEQDFVEEVLGSTRIHPAYYKYMADLNGNGVGPIPRSAVPELNPDELDGGSQLIDVRPTPKWAAGHFPGSINVPFGASVAQYVGWVIDWHAPLILIGDQGDITKTRLHLARIGYDAVRGIVTRDLENWGVRYPTERTSVSNFAGLSAALPDRVLDVRDPQEVKAGSLSNAIPIHFADLREEAYRITEGETWIYCGSGYRAAIAAGLIERVGGRGVVILDEWQRNGAPLAKRPQPPPTRT